jgi:hypothetical protein
LTFICCCGIVWHIAADDDARRTDMAAPSYMVLRTQAVVLTYKVSPF